MSTEPNGGTGKSGKRRGRPPVPEEVYCQSAIQLAWVFGTSERTVRVWSAKGAPEKTDQGYSVRDWVAWWSANIAAPAADALSGSLEEEKILAVRAGRELDEEKLRKLRGEVIDRTEAESREVALVQRLVGILARQPAEVSGLIAHRSATEVRRKLTEWNNAARREWAKHERSGSKSN